MGLIYLDSCLLIYSIEEHPQWAAKVLAAMEQEAPATLAISSLVKMECLIKPLRDGDRALQKRYEAAMEQLVLLPITDAVFLEAAALRAHFNVKAPDALHLACAQHHGCKRLWTNDDRLVSAGHGLALNVLRS
jgi:uncharacterized protein